MQPARRGGPTRAVAAVVLLLLGLAAFGGWRIASGAQELPFDKSAAPPSSVQVTKGNTYSLAVPGGVRAMIAHHVPVRYTNGQNVIVLQCTSSSTSANGTSGLPLTVTPESSTTKAENTVGHFVAPDTGRIHVDCAGWGAMFVPDSNDRAYDWAGLALLIAVITLTIGAALALTEVRLAWERRPSAADLEDDDADAVQA
jgi:hypothetical protein